mgnify:CR=1 FL=1
MRVPAQAAARSGSLEVLKVRKEGCIWDASCAEAAAWFGDKAMVKWVVAKDCPFRPESVCAVAVYRNNLPA